MRNVINLVIICVVSFTISACKKKTVDVVVPILSNPLGTISQMAGTKQWHGQYIHEEYNSAHTHIDQFQSDTSMSFALTIANDSVILYDIFNSIDSLFYVRTNELEKSIFYIGNKFQGSVYLLYYYSTNKIDFKMDGLSDSGLFVTLKLSTP